MVYSLPGIEPRTMHAGQALYQLGHFTNPQSHQRWLLEVLDLSDYLCLGEPGESTSCPAHLAHEVGLPVFLTPRLKITAKTPAWATWWMGTPGCLSPGQ